MAQKTLTIVQNKQTGSTYYTKKSKKGDNVDKKLKLKKYDPVTRQHEIFEEIKGHRPKSKKKVEKPAAKKATKKSK
jgi:ribosomal protein L33